MKRARGSNRPHRPLGNVLVATDFSPGGERAVARAARLPIRPGSALTIVHVLPETVPGLRGWARAEARRALDSAAARARAIARASGLRIDVFVRLVSGTPHVEIVRTARRNRAELIVVGRHGQRTFRDLVLGSTAERVVRKGDRSMLVVGSPSSAGYAHPLVAIDLGDLAQRAFALALRIAPDAGAPEVVHAGPMIPAHLIARLGFPPGEERRYRRDVRKKARARVDAFLATLGEPGRQARVVLRCGDAREVVLDAAARRRADLLAVGTHGRSGLAHALLGSVAEAVVRGAPCDVLVARLPGLASTPS